jgi:Transglutaminase-like superfamily
VTLPTIALLHKFSRLPWHDRLLVLEATFCLAVAVFAIAMLPFRHVGRLASRQTGRPVPPQQIRLTEVRSVRWAIIAAARQVPWHAMCFQQGLAAQLMLRRRGIPSVLYYGAAPDGLNGLAAHVWVRDGDVNVIGGEIASRFALLATFPPQCESKP